MYELSFGVTQSILSKFLQCPRSAQHMLSGIRSKPGAALLFGELVHKGLASIRLGKSTEWVQRMLLTDTDNASGRASSSKSAEDYILHGEMATGLLVGYQKHWFRTPEASLGFFAIESTFDTVWEGFRLRGKIDALWKDGHGNIYIVESKTHSQIPKSIDDSLLVNFQALFYSLVVEELSKDRVAGIIYDMLRTPQLRRKDTESPRDYLDRVSFDVADRPGFYFNRFEVTFTQDQKDEFKANLRSILKQFAAAVASNNMFQSYRCITRGTCEYLPLCATGVDADYQKGVDSFKELTND